MVLIRRSDAEGRPEEFVTKDTPFPVEVVDTAARLALTPNEWGVTVSSTAVPVTSPPDEAQAAEIYVRTASVVFVRSPGDLPTATRGFQADAGDIILLYSQSEIQHFRAIRQGWTDATLDVEFFSKAAG